MTVDTEYTVPLNRKSKDRTLIIFNYVTKGFTSGNLRKRSQKVKSLRLRVVPPCLG